jgi:hypothetical protein
MVCAAQGGEVRAITYNNHAIIEVPDIDSMSAEALEEVVEVMRRLTFVLRNKAAAVRQRADGHEDMAEKIESVVGKYYAALPAVCERHSA